MDNYNWWYHPIDLKDPDQPKVNCPNAEPMRPIWDQIREVRKGLDYHDKLVLDVASADGMWAFEAEELGAKQVVAVDMGQPGYFQRLLLARASRKSNILPFYSVYVQRLYEHLEAYFTYHTAGQRFEIIQNLGLFYHVRDILLCLSQCRKCMVEGGELLLEGAFFFDKEEYPLALFNYPDGLIYKDASTWWAPNKRCLYGLLKTSLFEPIEISFRAFHQSSLIGRFCIIAKAVGTGTVNEWMNRELGLQYLT